MKHKDLQNLIALGEGFTAEFKRSGTSNLERGSTPVEVPEMQTAARQIIERLKEDGGQYCALLKSIGESTNLEAQA